MTSQIERCTWEGCEYEALHPMIAQDGKRWANLCAAHKLKFDGAIDAKTILAVWVKAQGGAKAAANRMMKGKV